MYTINIISEKKLVIMVFCGKVDFQEIIKANAEVTADPRFKQSFSGVVDHRKSNILLSAEELNAIAASVSSQNQTVGRWVLMVESPEKTAFSTLYVNNIKNQHPQNVCSTIKGASKYLGVNLTEYIKSGSFD
jgi:hypothetical protein